MIISMTGFGQSQIEYGGKLIRVEIRTLNARNSEIRCKLPGTYRDREIDLRKKVMDGLSRGKIELNISIEGLESTEGSVVDAVAFRKYYKELFALTEELGITGGDILQSILRIPNVLGQNEALADDEEWIVVAQCVDNAIKNLQKYRADEGESLKKDLIGHINQIELNLKAVEPLEEKRINHIKDRIRKSLDEFLSSITVDQNRFEQEIIYYLEKLDINEEKVRLGQHCQYFKEELESKEEQKGRKLAFIGQEIGREINTMGAKAQDSEIQQHVVIMKDELEKLKEQLANIL
jgi:uncharacterized protein (TIGR00255 family)